MARLGLVAQRIASGSMQKSQPRFFEVGYRTLFVEVSVRFFLEVCVQFVVAGVKVHRDHGANGERKCEGREKDKFPHGSSPDFVRRHRRVAGHFDAGDKGSMKTISSESLTDILSNPIRIARFSIRTTLLSKTNHAPETGGQSATNANARKSPVVLIKSFFFLHMTKKRKNKEKEKQVFFFCFFIFATCACGARSPLCMCRL
jgi:hypothetical protein